MPNYAQATICGHLGRDPETKHLPDGKPVASFSVATTRKIRGEDQTTWWRVSAFGRTAEIAQQYLRKGSPVLIAGEPMLREYDAKDGTRKASLEILADRLTLLGGRDGNAGETSSVPASRPASTPRQQAQQAGLPVGSGDLDDIPF